MMHAREFEAVLEVLPKLSRGQLDRLAQEIKASMQFAEPGRENDELLTYICSYCRRHHFDYRGPEKMRGSRYYKLFMEKHETVAKYLRSFCKRRLEREAICHLVFDEMRMNKIAPMNCVGLMSVVHLIPGQLESMFPGYADTGLLPLIAKRLAA